MLIQRVLSCIAVVIVVSVPAVAHAQCNGSGTARWPVKTSAISSATNTASQLDVAAFVIAPDLGITSAPNNSFIDQNVTIGGVTVREGQLVQVTGYLSDVHCDKDGDYHGDLRANDSGTGPPCAIVEVPYPPNVANPETNARVSEARQAFDQWLDQHTIVHVTLVGQLFYDSTHHSSTNPGGGRGTGFCAKTLWEIHPVLKVFVAGAQTPQPTLAPSPLPTTPPTTAPTITPTPAPAGSG